MSFMKRTLLISALAVITTNPVTAATEDKIEMKIDALLKKMTLAEKVHIWHGCSGFEVGGIERLNIPKTKMTDGPQGVRGPTSTYFPTGIAMAASWNVDLMEKTGAALGRETRAAGCGVLLGPGVNIMRTPLCGRNFEYFGEDPFLAGKIAAAYIRGIQSENVAACVKHLVGNNQEWCRTTGSSEIGERALREIYLPAFKTACEEGKTWSIMSAYNKVNGTFASANKKIQQDIPKDEWGWNGAMISDWGGAHDWKGCATGGLDIIMPGPAHNFANKLIEAVKKGDIAESIVNNHARRSLRLIFRTQSKIKGKAVNTKEHQALSRELARESITLLKNDGLLPLNYNGLNSIAVIGPNADKQHSMDGVRGSGGSGAVNPPYEITPLAGLKHLVGDKIKINYAEGYRFGDGMNIIPAQNLKVDGRDGLKGEYFDNMKLAGKPTVIKVDGVVNFKWTNQVAATGMPNNKFSVRWRGELIAPVTGEYTLGLESDDGSKLYLDEKEIIDHWKDQGMTLKTTKVNLQAGKSYQIKVEYYDAGGEAEIKLLWKKPKSALEPFAEAIKAAKNSDIAVVFVGTNHTYDREALGWGKVPNSDRPDLDLIGPGAELIQAVTKVNPNTVVVMIGGGPLLVEGWHSKVKAVLMGWYPGQEGGHAIAEVLFGKVNPSGKTNCTWSKQLNDWACHANGNYPGIENGPVQYDEGIWVGYRHFEKQNIQPRYPFGHGLSYTKFEMSGLELPKTMVDSTIKIKCKVKNVGDREGSEVVQLYIGDEKSSVSRPVKELKGFKKIKLLAGETKEVQFTVNRDALSFYDVEKKKWVAEPGKFVIYIGSSAQEIKLKKSFFLKQ